MAVAGSTRGAFSMLPLPCGGTESVSLKVRQCRCPNLTLWLLQTACWPHPCIWCWPWPSVQVLAGSPEYHATGGSASFKGQDLLGLHPEERGRLGLFLRYYLA